MVSIMVDGWYGNKKSVGGKLNKRERKNEKKRAVNENLKR